MTQCFNSCEENSSSVIVPPCHNHPLNLIEVAIQKTRVLTESEKYKLLTASEKAQLKSFVNTPFVNYNKSTEILARHCKNVYHLRAVQRLYTFNPEIRIDSRLTDTNQKNFLFNSEILLS